MRCKKEHLTQDFNEMVLGLEIRTGTLWTQRRMCQDERPFPITNSMIKKLTGVSHKVKADPFFSSTRGEKRQLETPRKTKNKDKV